MRGAAGPYGDHVGAGRDPAGIDRRRGRSGGQNHHIGAGDGCSGTRAGHDWNGGFSRELVKVIRSGAPRPHLAKGMHQR